MKTKCIYCDKEIEKDLYHIKRAKNNFCSIKCKSLYQHKQNLIVLKEDYAILKIKDIEILIDKEDIIKINKLKWSYKYDKTVASYYVQAWERNKTEKTRKRILLHRYLMNTPKGLECDHINRNTLDNRKYNLRNVSSLENAQNKGFYKNNKSGYKYISWSKANNIWVCEIKNNKKVIYRKCRKNLKELVNLRDEFLKGGDAKCQ